MLRLVAYVVLGLVAFSVFVLSLGYLAPVIIPALIGLVILAWRKPSAVERITNHRRLSRVPRVIRATPMRFALSAAILFIPLSAIFGNAAYLADEPATPDNTTQTSNRLTQPAVSATRSAPHAAATSLPTPTNGVVGVAGIVAAQQTGTAVPPTATLSPPTPTASSPADPTTVPTETPEPLTPTPVPLGDAGQVTRVIDGDTLDVNVNGGTFRVRIIGVDTPETKDPNRPVMCYGAEATAKTQELVDRAGGNVILEKDISDTDRYGRLLRYVWLLHPDGQRMLNFELVSAGYAQVSTYPPDVRYADQFLDAQRQAREEGRGLWGACGEFGVPATPPTPTPVPVAPVVPQQPIGNCDPAYPTVCIPPPPPDLDCKDISFRRFVVLSPDPHRFDQDGDGVGCEGR